MIRERLCADYLREILRLEASLRELEEEMRELRMQLNLKVDEANRLAIENANLRHKLEVMERRERRLIELFERMNVPLVVVDEESFEDVDVDLTPDTKE